MHPARQPRGPRALLLAVLLLTAVLGLSQCKLVQDQLTNVDPMRAVQEANGGSPCLRECRREYRHALKEERKLHKRNLRACCDRDDGDEDEDEEDDDLRVGDVQDGAQVGRQQGVGEATSQRGDADGGKDVAVNRGDDDDDDDHGDDDDPDHDGGRGDDDCDPECVKRENARHAAAVAAIEAAFRECVKNCHHQGGGIGN